MPRDKQEACWHQWCAGKCFTAGSLGEKKALIVVFASFHGVNTSTLPVSSCQHDIAEHRTGERCVKWIPTILHEQPPTHCWLRVTQPHK